MRLGFDEECVLLQDCEYAFVLDRASSKLPDADKEGAAPFDKVRASSSHCDINHA